MRILAIGLSHKTAPLSVRERLALTNVQQDILLKAVCDSHSTIHEGVVVATCNRLEVYAVVDEFIETTEMIIRLIGQISQAPDEVFCPYLYFLHHQEAVEHLMRVAAGLDSMVLGEAQILGQLVTAYQTALSQHTAKAILGRLFQIAIHAGKRVRTETAVGRNPASISSVAVQLAEHHLDDLSNRAVMVVGAGEMGELAVQALVKHGVGKLFILNRSLDRARDLAATWGAATSPTTEIFPLTLADLPQALPKADLVITSTGATRPILSRTLVAQAITVRPERPMLIVDIGLPRDVEATAGALPNVHLYNLDDLNAQIAHNLKEREWETPLVEVIVEQESETFWAWYRARTVAPAITHFRDQIESIKEAELNRTLRRLQHLNRNDRELVVELAHRLANKFMHQPTVALKAEAAQGDGAMATNALQKFFGLEVDQPQ